MGVCIVGLAHGPFGRHDGLDLEGLVASLSGRAIEHAGVPAQDIDATWLGQPERRLRAGQLLLVLRARCRSGAALEAGDAG